MITETTSSRPYFLLDDKVTQVFFKRIAQSANAKLIEQTRNTSDSQVKTALIYQHQLLPSVSIFFVTIYQVLSRVLFFGWTPGAQAFVSFLVPILGHSTDLLFPHWGFYLEPGPEDAKMGTVGTILGDPEAVGRDDAHAELKTTEVGSAISLVVFWRCPRHLLFLLLFVIIIYGVAN